MIKRTFDIVGALVLLLVFSPLMLIIAAMIFATSGPHLIFGHERITRGHRKFKCLKFRTMVRNADELIADILENDPDAQQEWNRSQKLRNDPRILPGIGHLLRASSLDELPQLFNVLRGEMSLVGPRPVTDGELSHYGAGLPLYLSVRPGLTGPWQIGERSDASFDTRVTQDLNYIRNWSLLTDIKIIYSTVKIVLKGCAPGAY